MAVFGRSIFGQTVTHIDFNTARQIDRSHRRLLHCLLYLGINLFAGWCHAGALQVQVNDRDGRPVEGAIVTISDRRTGDSVDSRKWIMDQINLRFEPQVLVVPSHATVQFPNSDKVSHQVYSFSRPKSFQLPLYKGSTHPPITFDTPGLVVLGCNIHDEMIGYIYVTSAHWFGQTDKAGTFAIVDNNADAVTVTVWSPYIADAEKTLTREVKITGSTTLIKFALTKSLRNAPEPRPRNPDWDY